MKINQIWDELANDTSFAKGLLLRRYSGSVLPDVFVAIQQPEKQLCIASSISESIDVDISQFDNLQEIQIELIPDPNKQEKRILIFKLTNNQHRDIFSVLCEDLIANIATETNERQLVKTLLNRFEKWKSLFTKIASEGLSPEEQRGLFGELYFLRKFMQHNNNYSAVLNTWVGPASEVRDFQMGNWALEVKTTHGNNHQKIQISSERQLDITHLEKLYIYHVSLEKVQESGETLNQIVSSISNLLSHDAIALNRFRSKLYEAGYFEQHIGLYDTTGYFIRQATFYSVEDTFPRIQEKELRSGVGDVEYSIILSQCEEFKQTEELVFQTLIKQ
ncbi:PD-(D/E)XK motif protein [Terrimonas sp.]|uniref:PD-(D/E)XK motif protein n=1 Tax=Terrimonas sp. TaxID=1914338 RepID=UPI000D514212|nr:PD-(D/E)XK motif protein [Terrimonas sp.]PVD53591.1 PD-(D/E)XK motif protein [Terrimonas sp.]